MSRGTYTCTYYQVDGEDISQSGGDDEPEPEAEAVDSESEGFVVSDGHLSDDEIVDGVGVQKKYVYT